MFHVKNIEFFIMPSGRATCKIMICFLSSKKKKKLVAFFPLLKYQSWLLVQISRLVTEDGLSATKYSATRLQQIFRHHAQRIKDFCTNFLSG